MKMEIKNNFWLIDGESKTIFDNENEAINRLKDEIKNWLETLGKGIEERGKKNFECYVKQEQEEIINKEIYIELSK